MSLGTDRNARVSANHHVLSVVAFGMILAFAPAQAADAAEVKVLSTIGIRAVMQELGPQFERATGHRLVITFDVAGALKRQIDAGEKFDVAILTIPVIDELIKAGTLVADTRVDVARSGMGLAVRAGAPKPDISSVEGFTRVLLDAKSVTYPEEGLTGVYLTQVQERLGIAAAIKAKAKLTTSGSPAELVARGEAEVAAHIVPELLAVQGVQVLGPFPRELQNYIVLPGGVATLAAEPKAGKELLQFLVGPAASAIMKARGYEPL